MLRTLRRLAFGRLGRLALRPAAGSLALFVASAAHAQYYGGYDPCSPCQTVCPTACQTSCQQMAMVVQPCYQQVPVTEYRAEKQVVYKPQVETAMVDQQVTTYQPVTEQRTVEQPYTTYQPVTEMQTVCQDRSYYQTRYTPNCRMSPCQYDCRPGFMGWMSRTGYEMRSAFTPKYTAHREYVPNRVVMQVPTTRYVAQQGTRQVTYNVTKYEPRTETRQVAVNRTKWVAEETTVQRPVTTYRTVPVGTTVAYAPVGADGSAMAFGGGTISNVAYGPFNPSGAQTAFGPTPDRVSAIKQKGGATRSATATPAPGKAPNPGEFKRETKAAPAAGDFGDVPASTSVPMPKLPKFRSYTATEREELLNTRRLAQAAPEAKAGELAAHQTLKPVAESEPAAELRHESALAMLFERPSKSTPLAIRGVRWSPKATGPELVLPSVASIE